MARMDNANMLRMVVDVLNSIAAIILGLHAIKFDVFERLFHQAQLHSLVMPLQIVFAVTGVVGLVLLLTDRNRR